jgi:hypothetical protein
VNYVARQNWLINVENAAKILKKLTASAIASSIDFLALNKQQWARLRCTFAFSLFSHSFHSLSECSALYSYYLKYATQNMQNMKTWKRLCLLRVIVNFHLREKQTSKLLWKASKECHSNGFILHATLCNKVSWLNVIPWIVLWTVYRDIGIDNRPSSLLNLVESLLPKLLQDSYSRSPITDKSRILW